MKVTLTKGTNSVELDLDQDTVAALLPCAIGGLVLTIGEPLAPVKEHVTIRVTGYSGATRANVKKIPAIGAIHRATGMALRAAKQAVEVPSGKRLVVPKELAFDLVRDLRVFGYGVWVED